MKKNKNYVQNVYTSYNVYIILSFLPYQVVSFGHRVRMVAEGALVGVVDCRQTLKGVSIHRNAGAKLFTAFLAHQT